MSLPAESLIAYTLDKMNARLAARPRRDDGRIRNGLLFTGNVHDSIPRRLLLDTRLSPLDKMGWMMIRLYAQNNEGQFSPAMTNCNCSLPHPERESLKGNGKPRPAYATNNRLAQPL